MLFALVSPQGTPVAPARGRALWPATRRRSAALERPRERPAPGRARRPSRARPTSWRTRRCSAAGTRCGAGSTSRPTAARCASASLAAATEWERLGRAREALWSAAAARRAAAVVEPDDLLPREIAFVAASRRAQAAREGGADAGGSDRSRSWPRSGLRRGHAPHPTTGVSRARRRGPGARSTTAARATSRPRRRCGARRSPASTRSSATRARRPGPRRSRYARRPTRSYGRAEPGARVGADDRLPRRAPWPGPARRRALCARPPRRPRAPPRAARRAPPAARALRRRRAPAGSSSSAPAELAIAARPPGARVTHRALRRGRPPGAPPRRHGALGRDARRGRDARSRVVPAHALDAGARARRATRSCSRAPSALGVDGRPCPRRTRVPAGFVYVPAGRFLFGCTAERGDPALVLQHDARCTRPGRARSSSRSTRSRTPTGSPSCARCRPRSALAGRHTSRA